MLSKKNRLNLKTEFKSIVSGKKLDTKYATLFFKYIGNVVPKVGIAVPSKVFKAAHQRNRARRLFSAAIENVYPRLKPGLNMIALPKLGVLEVKSTDVTVELSQILADNGLLI